MTAPWRVPLPALIGAAAVACGPGAPADGTPSSGLAGHVALEARAASGALSAPFGFGRPARADELRAQDIDVGPDGRGLLPAGSGTVAEGRALYAARCAVCHGANGEGGPNDRLVGTEPVGPDGFPRTIGNYWPYAPTLFDYTRRAMPLDAPGSLTDDQVYGLVAFLLNANGIVEDDAIMDAATLSRLEMPAVGRFVPDDRLEYQVVR